MFVLTYPNLSKPFLVTMWHLLGMQTWNQAWVTFWVVSFLKQEIESIRVPVQNPKCPRGMSVATFPIVHPHRVVAYLFNDVKLQIADSEVQEFWAHHRSMNEPWAVSSPATSKHIPLGIHGDAARLWTQYQFEKVIAIWMNVILFRPASVRHSRFLLFSCPHAVTVKNRTLNCVWRRLVWSFNSCFEGVNPLIGVGGKALVGSDLTRAGTPLTSQNHKFILCEFRGDWEWHRDTFRFTASWNGINTCFKCPAQSKGLSEYLYHNIGPDSVWLQEEFGFQQFIARRLKENQLCNLIFISVCYCRCCPFRTSSAMNCYLLCKILCYIDFIWSWKHLRPPVGHQRIPPWLFEMVCDAHPQLGADFCLQWCGTVPCFDSVP